ncbi:MAG: hypothetical protein ACR2NZ_10365, partial [Rubripirellula sp.]
SDSVADRMVVSMLVSFVESWIEESLGHGDRMVGDRPHERGRSVMLHWDRGIRQCKMPRTGLLGL